MVRSGVEAVKVPRSESVQTVRAPVVGVGPNRSSAKGVRFDGLLPDCNELLVVPPDAGRSRLCPEGQRPAVQSEVSDLQEKTHPIGHIWVVEVATGETRRLAEHQREP